MPTSAVFRRGTAMPDSDTKELVSQWNIVNSAFVLSTAVPANGRIMATLTGAASFSVNAFYVLGAGSIVKQAAATSGGFTGINVATGAFALVAAYRTAAGTLAVVAGTTGATIGACGLPVVPTTAAQYGLVVIGGGATAFTGGATALDATNAAADFLDVIGPMGLCVSTAPITSVPG